MFPYHQTIQSLKQIQIKINEQKIAQKQAQNNIDLTLRGLLYYLETIAYRPRKFERKFVKYNPNSIQGIENKKQ